MCTVIAFSFPETYTMSCLCTAVHLSPFELMALLQRKAEVLPTLLVLVETSQIIFQGIFFSAKFI